MDKITQTIVDYFKEYMNLSDYDSKDYADRLQDYLSERGWMIVDRIGRN